MKQPEQAEDQPSLKVDVTYIAKILLRDFGLFIVLPVVILLTLFNVIPFPLSYVVVDSLLIFWGLLIIIFAAAIFRHFDHLLLRMKRQASKVDPEYTGAEIAKLFDIVYLRFLSLAFRIWVIRFYGAVIAGVFAYQLYRFLTA